MKFSVWADCLGHEFLITLAPAIPQNLNSLLGHARRCWFGCTARDFLSCWHGIPKRNAIETNPFFGGKTMTSWKSSSQKELQEAKAAENGARAVSEGRSWWLEDLKPSSSGWFFASGSRPKMSKRRGVWQANPMFLDDQSFQEGLEALSKAIPRHPLIGGLEIPVVINYHYKKEWVKAITGPQQTTIL